MTNRFVVFGSSGFLGHSLCWHLAQRDIPFLALSRKGTEATQAALDVPAQYEKLLLPGDTVVLLASGTSSATPDNDHSHELTANVRPHKVFLDAVSRAGISQLIYISSGGAVYGASTAELIGEDEPLMPTTAYGWGKQQIEQIMRDFSRRSTTRVTILRPANPVGIRQLTASVGFVTAAVNAAMKDVPLRIWGTGSTVRDYFDVEDFCRAVTMTAASAHPSGTALNIGSGIGRSQVEVVDMVQRAARRTIRVEFLPSRPNEIPRNVLSVRRAEDLISWRPTIPLAETLDRLVAAYTS